MLAMAEKKPKRGRPPQAKKLSVQISVRLAPEWADALDAYCASLRPTPDRPDVIRVALEDFLLGKGFAPKIGRKPKSTEEAAE
jgi:hypothetical protein